MSNDIDNLEEYIDGLSSDLKEQFTEYFQLIEKYNSKINLISKGTVSRAGSKHFADSYLALKMILPNLPKDVPIFDFGSGNGFPGMILGMMEKARPVILVERDLRKAQFLKLAADELLLDNIEVHGGSINELTAGSCVAGISRAMAPLPKFLLETREAIQSGGRVFLFKGDHWTSEFGSCPPQIFDFWDVNLLGSYMLPGTDPTERFIIQCDRIKS